MEKEFINLVYKHIGILHKVCNSYFFKNPCKEDYFQEILIRLWKAYPTFRNQSSFSTWMYRVTINSAIDIIRKRSILPVHIELSKNELKIPVSFSFSESEEKEKLYSIINYLNINEKAIILMYLDEFSYEEIAENIGISKSNVGVKINRIKNKLIKISNSDEYK